jgi:hypothetical protein
MALHQPCKPQSQRFADDVGNLACVAGSRRISDQLSAAPPLLLGLTSLSILSMFRYTYRETEHDD